MIECNTHGLDARFVGRCSTAIRIAVVLVSCLLGSACHAAVNLTDNFADRQLLTDESGRLDGSNVGMSVEPDEPRHGGKTGGHSAWVSWLAPADGIATFWTDGSTFDTLLSSYYFNSANDTTLDKLRELARNDDASVAAAPSSLIQFGVHAGVQYHIAIDGFAGAVGDIRLRWDFINATSPPPIIVSVPNDQAAREGDTVTLTIDLVTTPNMRLQWRFNGNSFGAEGQTLIIPSLQPANVGRYTLRIDLGDVRFETPPVELQINSDGQTNALARDKLIDALTSPLSPTDDDGGGGGGLFRAASGPIVAAGAGVSRGYNGVQVFDTTFATPDPGEPVHCGISGGASYWYAYAAPADGTVTLDSIGSTFDTFIAVYAFNAPFGGYADLIPVACDDNSAGTNGAARLEFAVPKGRQFLVVLDGVNGARGIAHLNYRLDTNRPPMAPTLLAAPLPAAAALGADFVLRPPVVGSPPLQFVWRKGTALITGATASELVLPQINFESAGDYFVSVSSYLGGPLEVRLPVRVVVAPAVRLLSVTDGTIRLSIENAPDQAYQIEHTADLSAPWEVLTNGFLRDGSLLTLSNLPTVGSHFFRLRVE